MAYIERTRKGGCDFAADFLFVLSILFSSRITTFFTSVNEQNSDCGILAKMMLNRVILLFYLNGLYGVS